MISIEADLLRIKSLCAVNIRYGNRDEHPIPEMKTMFSRFGTISGINACTVDKIA